MPSGKRAGNALLNNYRDIAEDNGTITLHGSQVPMPEM